MIFDIETINLFRSNKPEEVLKQNIYQYRDKVNDDNYHFLIGVCMLKLGFLHEAFVAFSKAISKKQSERNKLFKIFTLIHAQRFNQAVEERKTLVPNNMTISELTVLAQIDQSLNLSQNISTLLPLLDEKKTGGVEDEMMLAITNLLLANQVNYRKAIKYAKEVDSTRFENLEDYFTFIEELCKKGIKNKDRDSFFNKWMKNNKFTKNNTLAVLKAMASTKYFFELSAAERNRLTLKITNQFENNNEILVQYYTMLYDLYEAQKDMQWMNNIAERMEEIENRKHNTKALLILVLQQFKLFGTTDKNLLLQRLNQIILDDKENMFYRKLYFEFCTQLGRSNEAMEINKSSILLQQKKEKRLVELIKAFHNFYITEPCPLNPPEGVKCPLCHGSNEMPIVRTIVFNTSPRDVYVEKFESELIAVNDVAFKKLVNWKPMNVPSVLIGAFLRENGAYMTNRPFPDVLVPGETYLFIRPKKEVLERLANEGYSISTIDPLMSVMDKNHKMKYSIKFPAEPGREVNFNDLPEFSADDFVIEVIKAI